MTEKIDISPDIRSGGDGGKREGRKVAAFFSEHQWLRRISGIVLFLWGEFTSITLGLAFVWLYVMNYVVAQKTIDISFLKPNVSLWFSEAYDGKSADVDDLSLTWNAKERLFVLDAINITVEDETSKPLQEISHLSTSFDFAAALSGRVVPKKIAVTGGAVSWVRAADGTVLAGLGTPKTVGKFGELPQNTDAAVNVQKFDMGPLIVADVKNADVFIRDKATGLDLTFNETSLHIQALPESVLLDLSAALGNDSDTAVVKAKAVFSQDFENFDLNVETKNLNPKDVAPVQGRFSKLAKINVPFDSSLTILAQRDNGLKTVEFHATSGKGEEHFGPKVNAINKVVLNAAYDAATGLLEFDELSMDTARYKGKGSVSLSNIGRPASGFFKDDVGFRVDLSALNLDFTSVFDAPFVLGSARVHGRLDPKRRSLDIDNLNLKFPEFSISSAMTLGQDGNGNMRFFRGTAKVSGDMTQDDLLAIWPSKFALGGRRWIERAVVSGLLSDLDLRFDIPRSVFQGGGLTDEDLILDFNVRDGHIKYISTMTPYIGASGHGVLKGNSLQFDVFGGSIGEIAVTTGQVNLSRLFPKGGDLIIDVHGKAKIQDMLRLIDQKPFEYTRKYGLDAEKFEGVGAVHLTIKRPLLEFFDRSEIIYEVDGEFEDVTLPYSVGKYALDKGDFIFQANKEAMSIDGMVNVGPWRTGLQWKETFGNPDIPTQYKLSGTVDQNTLHAFGLGFREYIGGTAEVTAEASGQGLSVDGAKVSLDLANSDIRFGEYWKKPINRPGHFSAIFNRDDDGNLVAENLEIIADGLTVEGDAAFAPDARLLNFDMKKVLIDGFADGAVKIAPNNNLSAFDVSMTGRFLDISPMVDRAIRANTSDVALPINLKASIERLILDDMFVLRDADMTVVHNGIGTLEAQISGDSASGKFSAVLSQDQDSKDRNLNIVIPDASRAVSAFLNIDSIRRGELKLRAVLPEVGVEGPLYGTVIVNDFALIQAPIFAQILSLASLRGLTDAMGGEGLGFAAFEAPFSYDSGTLSLREARASGPALGLTGSGEIDFSAKTVDLEGVLVPAYTANSALSAIPVIGDIFVGKKGEGIFALNYMVKGPFSKTQVAVNPLSALTPGFLRRIFETDREDIPQQAEGISENEPVTEE